MCAVSTFDGQRLRYCADEPGRRVIVVGDVHGMIKPLK